MRTGVSGARRRGRVIPRGVHGRDEGDRLVAVGAVDVGEPGRVDDAWEAEQVRLLGEGVGGSRRDRTAARNPGGRRTSPGCAGSPGGGRRSSTGSRWRHRTRADARWGRRGTARRATPRRAPVPEDGRPHLASRQGRPGGGDLPGDLVGRVRGRVVDVKAVLDAVDARKAVGEAQDGVDAAEVGVAEEGQEPLDAPDVEGVGRLVGLEHAGVALQVAVGDVVGAAERDQVVRVQDLVVGPVAAAPAGPEVGVPELGRALAGDPPHVDEARAVQPAQLCPASGGSSRFRSGSGSGCRTGSPTVRNAP